MSESGRKGVAYVGEVKLTNHVDCNPCHLHWNDVFVSSFFFSPFSLFPRIGLA